MAIVGISTDTVALQTKFADKEKLTFPLLADFEHKAAKAFGVIAAGKTNAQRSTFIIHKDGTINKVFGKVGSAKDHPQEVLDYVEKNLAKK